MSSSQTGVDSLPQNQPPPPPANVATRPLWRDAAPEMRSAVTAEAPGGTPSPLTGRLGGPVGRHAVRSGVWFNPAPWTLLAALITWLVCLWHQRPCEQTEVGKPINALLRLCYSDIPIMYQTSGIGTGQLPYRDFRLDYGPTTAAFMMLARWITQVLGFPSRPGVSEQQVLDGANAWFLVSAVLLGACFFVLVLSHLLLGRGSARSGVDTVRGRVRSWDAMFVAAAPVVAAAGLVNYDMVAAALVALGLLAWALRRPMLAGVFLGLAIGAKFYPLVIIFALFLLCVRAGQRAAFRRLLLGAVGSWLLVNVPVMAVSFTNWMQWYADWVSGDAELGSLWYLVHDAGLTVPHPGMIGALLFLAFAAFVTQRAMLAPRRPRLGQLAFLLVAALTLTERGYPPQHVLWLLPLLALARPVFLDWAVFCVVELLYFWAVWGHLSGSTVSAGENDGWYWMAVLARITVLVWLCERTFRDIRRPWNDPVRKPFVDDPIGGVLDHTPDAGPPPPPTRGIRAALGDDVDGANDLELPWQPDGSTDSVMPEPQP